MPSPDEAAAAVTPDAAAFPSKASPLPAVMLGIGLIVVAAGAAVWYFHGAGTPRPSAKVPGAPSAPAEPNATEPSSSAPSATNETAAPASSLAQSTAPAKGTLEIPAHANQKAHTHKPAPPPAAPPPETSPQAGEIVRLENLAREAYAKGNYVEPLDASAITHLKRVLALNPSDNYSKTLLEDSVNGGKYQAQQALKAKDFASARRLANELAQLMPGRNDIAELQEDISIAEKSKDLGAKGAVAVVSFLAYHMHSDKAPADHGPYCLGTLSVVVDRVKFTGASVSTGQQVHNFDLACSDVRDIKKNAHVASHQGGFHIRAASLNINFAPEDSSLAHVSALASACGK